MHVLSHLILPEWTATLYGISLLLLPVNMAPEDRDCVS